MSLLKVNLIILFASLVLISCRGGGSNDSSNTTPNLDQLFLFPLTAEDEDITYKSFPTQVSSVTIR